jgi:hypothetical protein
MAVVGVPYGFLVGVCTCFVDTLGGLRDAGQHSRAGVALLPVSSDIDCGNGAESLYDGPPLRYAPHDVMML